MDYYIEMGTVFAIVVTGYLLGSFPTSYLMGKVLRGIDIRDHGSGNVGATNTFRVLGPHAGVAVLLIDIAKGFIPVSLITPLIACHFSPILDLTWLKILAGMSAIAGHNWSVFLGFRGGKGVATSMGVLLGISPKALGLSTVVWLIVTGSSKYVSLGSIAAAITLPVFMCLSGEDGITIVFGMILTVLIVVKHRANIVRLIHHSENKINIRRKGN